MSPCHLADQCSVLFSSAESKVPRLTRCDAHVLGGYAKTINSFSIVSSQQSIALAFPIVISIPILIFCQAQLPSCTPLRRSFPAYSSPHHSRFPDLAPPRPRSASPCLNRRLAVIAGAPPHRRSPFKHHPTPPNQSRVKGKANTTDPILTHPLTNDPTT